MVGNDRFLKTKFSHYKWSIRSLDRHLRFFEIYYDKNVPVEDVVDAVQKELDGPGALLGYQAQSLINTKPYTNC